MLKKKLRRLSAMLMAGVMAVSMFGTAFANETPTDPSVSADDYSATNAYILNYSNQDIEGYEEWDTKILYASRYRTDHSVTNPDGSVEWWGSPACVMNMINPSLIDGREADYPYASIPVYCVDGPTNAITGTAYRRIDLEDSTYFSDEVAGRLRAVVADAFPFEKDMSVLTNKVNAWIDANNLDYKKIENLNEGEVISSVQSVIWVLANNGEFDSSKVYMDDRSRYGDLTCVYDYTKYYATENTADNIEALVWYLMDLEPVAPSKALASNTSFKAWDVVYTQDAETGKYTATVTAIVDADVDADDELTLSAIAGDKMQATAVQNGRNEYTFTFTGLDTQGVAKLAIDGTQSAEGVFLFDPIDGRYTSQSMIGCDNSTLPVHAEITVEPERSIIIEKSTKVDNGSDGYDLIPLEGINFDIYKVCDLDAYLNGTVSLGAKPSDSDIATYAIAENNVATVTTDENGKAKFSLTLNNLPDGVYMVVEREHPATTGPVAPFFVMVPTTDASGEGWDYTIEVHPKNEVIGGPDIEKDVTSIGNNHDTYGVGETHTWIIGAEVPVDIAGAKEYIISDQLDYRLDYVGNVIVKLEDSLNATAEPVVLTAVEDYTLVPGKAEQTVGETVYPVDTFTVSLTPAGMTKIATAIGEGNFADYMIRVYFDAKINANTGFGVEIPNQAHLDYKNSVGFEYDADSDIPEVHTAGIKVIKKDGNTDSPLSLAHFQLARKATEAEIASPDINTSSLKISESEGIEVVYVEFYTDAAMTTKSDVVITDTDGLAYLYGIPYDTYYLVEIKAPKGYNLLPLPIKIEIGGPNGTDATGDIVVNHTNANTEQTVLNFTGFELPETGGIGTTVYTLMGSMTMAASSMYIFLKKRED